MTAVILEIGVIHLELDHVDKGGLSVDDASNHDGEDSISYSDPINEPIQEREASEDKQATGYGTDDEDDDQEDDHSAESLEFCQLLPC